uniref:Maltose/galactoside acetyltransferase domain-containing protein n=1 Tax=Acrobeloides nanus TaxID=290746 RepID=A0A914EIM5_9BILA
MPTLTQEILEDRQKAKVLLYEYNHLHPEKVEEKRGIIKKLIEKTGKNFTIESPFHCDYGYNIELGENFYSNVNLLILDEAKYYWRQLFYSTKCWYPYSWASY